MCITKTLIILSFPFACLELRLDEEERNLSPERRLKLKDLLENRKCDSAMLEFCDRFLECVVGKVQFKGCHATLPVREYAKVSDEAYTMLVLKNVWDAMMKQDLDACKRKKLGIKDNTTQKREMIMGQFTKNKKEARKYGGWNEEGIKFYNECREKVKQYRKTYSGWDDDLHSFPTRRSSYLASESECTDAR